MVFNITYNNISAISVLSVVLVEETGVPGENLRPAFKYFVDGDIPLNIGAVVIVW
jgi:hypothetical protein